MLNLPQKPNRMEERFNMFRLLAGTILALALLVAAAPAANAQDQCAPISGVIYGWYTDNWHGVMSIKIGRTSGQASLLGATTGFVDTGDVYRGTEDWTIDLGHGDIIKAKTHFVVEHATDATSATGVLHVTEGGQIVGGAGKYANAYGNIMSVGPFGNIKLPKTITTPANAQAYWLNPFQGMICH